MCTRVCVREEYNIMTVIYYFGGFDVYIIVDLVKCSVLTLVAEVGAMQITAIVIKRAGIF